MSDDDNVKMYPVMCDAGCGRRLGWCDTQRTPNVILCTHCMDNPAEVEARLAVKR